tara:strand:- start:156 stop:1175 length:1020 start_codon:yes stop_codon:yes gene_type:complete
MRIAQRGTSSTTTGIQTVDRFGFFYNANASITQAQVDVASGTTPYSLGFRKAYKATNGNQGSLGSQQIIEFKHKIEAQDVASSGWNYTDPNSFITLSFWVKSSVSFNMKGYFFTQDNSYNYPLETGTLSANTWTKITKTIPGNSNLVFNNDNGDGIVLSFGVFGSFFSSGNPSVNQWGAYSSATLTNPSETTWWLTNNATLEFTGVQLEVGSVATEFEHRSFGQELALCQRYFEKSFAQGIAPAQNHAGQAGSYSLLNIGSKLRSANIPFKVVKRTSSPTITYFNPYAANANARIMFTSTDLANIATDIAGDSWFNFTSTDTTPSPTYCHLHWTANAEL